MQKAFDAMIAPVRRLLGRIADTRQVWIRSTSLAVAWLASIGIIAGSIPWVFHIWDSVAKQDRVTDIGAVFTFATLLLGLIAGLVAISAYAISTGRPKLKVRILFSYQEHFNQPVFETLGETETDYDEDKVIAAGESSRKVAYIWIRNFSSYSAKSPAVIISLDPDYTGDPKMALLREPPGPADENEWRQSWKDVEYSTDGKSAFAFQWDGGPYPIHGKSIRRLPNLSFDGLYFKSDKGRSTICGVDVHIIAMRVELLADGFRHRVPIKVTFVPKGKQAEVAVSMNRRDRPEQWE